jgi:hypothetical protein
LFLARLGSCAVIGLSLSKATIPLPRYVAAMYTLLFSIFKARALRRMIQRLLDSK